MNINLIRTLVCKLTCLPTTARNLYISIRYIFKTKMFSVLQLTFTSNLKKKSFIRRCNYLFVLEVLY